MAFGARCRESHPVGDRGGCVGCGSGPGVTSPKSRPSGMQGRPRWLQSRSRLSSRARYPAGATSVGDQAAVDGVADLAFNARMASLLVLPSLTRRSK